MNSTARWLVLSLFVLGGIGTAVALALSLGTKQPPQTREVATAALVAPTISTPPTPVAPRSSSREEEYPFRSIPVEPALVEPKPVERMMETSREIRPLKSAAVRPSLDSSGPIFVEPSAPIAQKFSGDTKDVPLLAPSLTIPDDLTPEQKATLEVYLKKTKNVLQGLEEEELSAAKGETLSKPAEKKPTPAMKSPETSEKSPLLTPNGGKSLTTNANGGNNAATSKTKDNSKDTFKENTKETARSNKNDRNRISRVPGEGDDHLSIHIQDMDLREVLDLLSEQGGLNILASNSVQGKVSASLNNVDIDTALSAILRQTGYLARRDGRFVYVGTHQDFQTMEQNLDRIGTRMYRPNYVRAAEVQHLVTPLLTPGVGTVSVTNQSEMGIATDGNKAGGDTFAGGEAILVKDYEAVLAQVDQIVAEIDKRPMQVHIEAMILSVKLDDEHSMGVDFQLLRDKSNIKLASGSPLSDLGQVAFKDGGFKFGFLDSSLGLFVNALETIGDTNVIATPRLLCLNKQRSEILIGAQLGYVSTTVTETSTSQKVEFLEIGTQLRLRPFISSDGLIRMEVHPELSTGSVQLKGAFTLPEKDVTQVTTNIMCRDGCTVIIGGLIRNDLATTGSQIPLLGNLPGVGPLFRQKKESTQRSEILVLITPHIVYDDACGEGDRAACEFKRRQSVYADEMSPIGKRYIGRKYFRLAQQAFAQGDDARALRFADMAIHFDPLSKEAIDLRADIWHGNHDGQYTGLHPKTLGTLQPVEGQSVSRWVPNDGDIPPVPPSEQGVRSEQIPLHPRDAGMPGPSRNIDKPQHLR